MVTENLQKAMDFIDSVDLAGIPRMIVEQDASVEAGEVFDKAKDQAAVVGSGVLGFAKGVDEDVRAAMSDAALLAQLLADKKASSATDPVAWFTVYTAALKSMGWLVQDATFQDYSADGTAVDVHQKVIEVLAAALGPAPAAAAIILATMNALKGMNPESSWIRIFSREAQHAKIARFQVGSMETPDGGSVLVSMLACLILANDTITQVLFFKWRQSHAAFQASGNKMSINRNALITMHPKILAKTQDFQNSFFSSIQDLDLTPEAGKP